MASKSGNMCSIRQIEDELKQFLEYCKENKLNQDEIAKLCQPLIVKRNRKFSKTVPTLAAVLLTLYLLSYIEFFSWHFTALGRILMIRALSVYDWQKLKGEKCLIPNGKPVPAPALECYHCETLDAIPYTRDTSAEYLKEYYTDLDLPVIFTYADPNNYPDLEAVFATAVSDRVYESSVPCRLATNIPGRRGATAGEVLQKVVRYDSFFVHFQNCDFGAVKAFRRVFPRPGFHTAELSPVQYSWVLASRSYNTSKFKQVSLRDRVTTLMQVLGGGVYRLYPVSECQYDCSPLEIRLVVGESLMFTSLWDLEYKPFDDGDNFAAILEAH